MRNECATCWHRTRSLRTAESKRGHIQGGARGAGREMGGACEASEVRCDGPCEASERWAGWGEETVARAECMGMVRYWLGSQGTARPKRTWNM